LLLHLLGGTPMLRWRDVFAFLRVVKLVKSALHKSIVNFAYKKLFLRMAAVYLPLPDF
jgi:hypothetical protein